MVANAIPLFVSLACLRSEVGEEIDLLFVLIKEAELLVDERLHTNTAYCIRLVEHLLVESYKEIGNILDKTIKHHILWQ